MIQLKNRLFKEANNMFDKNLKKDPIASIKMMDEWIQSVLKYVERNDNKNG